MKVSIIIPMYNTEKYVGECLESILNQTFQDYEVIVVDDCSTDDSIKVVESFKDKFNGRLQVIKLKKNYNSPAYPRNKGLKLAKGDYIFFVDSDDLILDTALEDLIKIADSTQADVLHANQFISSGEEIDLSSEIQFETWEKSKPVKKISPITNNLDERINLFCQNQFTWSCWNKLFKRELLIKNKIEFATIAYSEDMPFCFKSLVLAKNYVRIPNVFYIYRNRQGSIQHQTMTAEKIIQTYLNVLIEGTKIFDSFMNTQKFFQLEDNLKYRYSVIDFFMREHLAYFDEIYKKYPVELIDVLNRETLIQTFGANATLVSYLFNRTNKR